MCQESKHTEEAEPMSDRIFNQISTIIGEQLGLDTGGLTEESDFIEDLGADSLDIVELIMELEEEFELEIPDEDAEQIATIGDAVQYIRENA
jgi:acyl carrier protein